MRCHGLKRSQNCFKPQGRTNVNVVALDIQDRTNLVKGRRMSLSLVQSRALLGLEAGLGQKSRSRHK